MSDGINSGGYPTSASTLPNVEDINLDNNLSEAESYFQYKIIDILLIKLTHFIVSFHINII